MSDVQRNAGGRLVVGAATGVRCLAEGLGFVARRPRLWLLGLLPALVVFVVLGAALTVLGVFAYDLASLVTPFADGWAKGAATTLRVFVALAAFGGAAVLAVLLFVTLTLLVGQPFYERLSRRVDQELGGAPDEPDEPVRGAVGRALRETLAMLARTVPLGLLVFVIGLIPVVGTVAGAVLGALVGGRFLALELLAPPMERRGRYLPDRLELGRRHRAAILGFGVPAFLAFVVPLVAVVGMPAAVAGATILARRLDGQDQHQDQHQVQDRG